MHGIVGTPQSTNCLRPCSVGSTQAVHTPHTGSIHNACYTRARLCTLRVARGGIYSTYSIYIYVRERGHPSTLRCKWLYGHVRTCCTGCGTCGRSPRMPHEPHACQNWSSCGITNDSIARKGGDYYCDTTVVAAAGKVSSETQPGLAKPPASHLSVPALKGMQG